MNTKTQAADDSAKPFALYTATAWRQGGNPCSRHATEEEAWTEAIRHVSKYKFQPVFGLWSTARADFRVYLFAMLTNSERRRSLHDALNAAEAQGALALRSRLEHRIAALDVTLRPYWTLRHIARTHAAQNQRINNEKTFRNRAGRD